MKPYKWTRVKRVPPMPGMIGLLGIPVIKSEYCPPGQAFLVDTDQGTVYWCRLELTRRQRLARWFRRRR